MVTDNAVNALPAPTDVSETPGMWPIERVSRADLLKRYPEPLRVSLGELIKPTRDRKKKSK